MTCLIGAVTADDRIIVACDSRVSWGNQGALVTDNLQKLYALSGEVLCAVCGYLVPAKTTLQLARAEVRQRRGRAAAHDAPQWLNALLRHKWMTSKVHGAVELLVASYGPQGGSVFVWTPPRKDPEGHRYLWPRDSVQKGQAVVLASVRNDPGLAKEVEDAFHIFSVHDTVTKLSDDQIAMIACDKLHQIFAEGRGDAVGVGGLFQIATWSKEGCFFHGFETSLLDARGDVYRVELRFDGNTWIQRRMDTGATVTLKSVDASDFQLAPRAAVRFVWRRKTATA